MQSEAFSRKFAESFKDAQVVDDYRFRPPYSPEVFTLLASLLTDSPRTILDVGSGSGDLARNCLPFAERIDAVDFSEQMIAFGKSLPHGNDPKLHWLYGRIEDIPLAPPYSLIMAGSSIHWPDWSIAFPRFQQILTPDGLLAIIYRHTLPTPWEPELRQIRQRYASRTNPLSMNTVAELSTRGYLTISGQHQTKPFAFQRSLDDYLAGLHSHSGMTRERMGTDQAEEFDAEVKKLVTRYQPDGLLTLESVANITWGKPESGNRMNELLEQTRAWVKEKGEKIANHLLKTEEWLVRINPGASEAARLAAVTHDMERAFPGEDSPKVDPSKGPADPEYNTAHQERSARIVRSYLESVGVSIDPGEQVGRLIQFHEYGGWPEANYLQAADSLSFLEVNVDYFIGRIGAPDSDWTEKYVGDKFTWMYERIQVAEARALARPLYEEAIQKLRKLSPTETLSQGPPLLDI